jgi:hypothetical protein
MNQHPLTVRGDFKTPDALEQRFGLFALIRDRDAAERILLRFGGIAVNPAKLPTCNLVIPLNSSLF